MKDLLEAYRKTKYLYDKYYDIHICAVEELDDLIRFIDKYWQKGHILTISKELMDWQHFDKENNRYNFIVARYKKDNEIHGILGFILSSVYDKDIQNPIRWGVIWKIRDDVAIKGLGVALKGRLEELVPVHYIGGVGLSEYSRKIDTKLGERMGKLKQYYIANPKIKEYKLIAEPYIPDNIVINKEKSFRRLDIKGFKDSVCELKNFIMPYKSALYYINRYFYHPIYKYQIVGIVGNTGHYEGVLVYRTTSADGSNNIFIVDFFGKEGAFRGIYGEFLKLMEEEEAECISFPCDGLSEENLLEAGFLCRDTESMILPVYYEPFEQSNVELDFHFWTDYIDDGICPKMKIQFYI